MKTLLSAAVAVSLFAVSGCGGGASEEAVAVKVFNFQPDPLTIEAGTNVTWTNEDSTRHNVAGRGFKGDLPEGGSYSHTFEEAGTYEYLCTLHSGPGMRAKVVVK